MWDNKNPSVLDDILQQFSQRFEYETLAEILVLLIRHLDEYVRDSISLIKLTAQTCSYSNICMIEQGISQGPSRIIERTLISIIKQSFEWTSYEQIIIWKIVNAHPVQ